MVRRVLGLPRFWRTLDNDSKWVWRFYFLLRLISTFYAYFVVSQLTQLGDTDRYMDRAAQLLLYDEGVAAATSTEIMDTLGTLSSSLFGKALGNIPFNILATYGIYYSVNKLKPPPVVLVFLLLLLSMHSFATWTTVASKEAVTVFGMGMAAGYLFDYDRIARKIPTLLELLGFAIVIIFKPQYLAALVHIWFFLMAAKWFRNKEILIALGIMVILVDIGFIWYYKDMINELASFMYVNFEDGGSSRINFWVNDYDVFRKAPYGIFIAFWGPTFSQILEGKWTMAFAFLESLVIVMMLMGMLFYVLIHFRYRVALVYPLMVLFYGWLWLLMVHYLSGALNAGSALRYRENFFAFFVVLLGWVYLKYKQFYRSQSTLVNKPLPVLIS